MKYSFDKIQHTKHKDSKFDVKSRAIINTDYSCNKFVGQVVIDLLRLINVDLWHIYPQYCFFVRDEHTFTPLYVFVLCIF